MKFLPRLSWRNLLPLLAVSGAAFAEERPLWMRYPSISPDGKTIVFTYQSQLWKVPSAGGEAIPLTSAAIAATKPVWSPDSGSIAFSSTRHGNPDVFVMPASGGEIRRLTVHSAADTPCAFTPDGKSVLFSSMRPGDPAVAFGGQLLGASIQLYSVPVTGGRERLVIPYPSLEACPAPDGRFILYTSLNASENEWRKHAVSEAARDIWVYDPVGKTHRQFTTWRGEDRNAVWSADGKSVFWLSEQSGSFNVWKRPLEGDAKPEQLTAHTTHPVRFLSRSAQNDLAYGFDGEIWMLPHGAKDPKRVEIHITQSSLQDGGYYTNMNSEASELAASPDGSQLAVVARGEVFVVEAASGKTRRITNTPQHERNISFSPDGRSVLYVSERDGRWDAFETTIATPGINSFLAPGPLKESRVTDTKSDVLQPAYSPDGKRVAYLDDRKRLQILDRATNQVLTALPEGLIYSYTDGDLPFVWSPDGRWLAVTTGSSANHFDVHLVDAAGKKPPLNLTYSGFHEISPQFSPDGKAVYYLSTREGLKLTDSKTAEADVHVTFLTQDAMDAFTHPADAPVTGKSDAAPAAPAPQWDPEIAGIENRSLRVTPFSSLLNTFQITPDGKALVMISSSPATGMTALRVNLGAPGISALFSKPGGGGFVTDGKPGNLYFFNAGGSIDRVNLSTGASSSIPFSAEIAYDLKGEMRYFFEHVWRTTQQKFYRADMRGVDWELYRREYEKFLPHIGSGEDLAEMFSEMAGELNASHMGSAYHAVVSTGDDTAALGLYYDHSHTGPGVKILDFLPGGPASRANSALRPGAVILAVNGETIREDMDIYPLLNRKAGHAVRLTIQTAAGGEPVGEIVTPYPAVNDLLNAHTRWVQQRTDLTEKLSGGRLGYVHVAAMDTANYQNFFARLHGPCAQKEALIVDVRFNGGGNLADQLVADLTAPSGGLSVSRDGVVLAETPAGRWTKPSILLANSFSYSDGSIFPHLYKMARIGSFVGDPVPGTGTSVWWMELLPGGRFKYGIPEIGRKSPDGSWFEGTEDQPDIVVRRNPDTVTAGRDEQLEAAVSAMLKQLNRK